MSNPTVARPTLLLWALTLTLAACGGGEDDPAVSASAGGGSLTISSATPAANNTTLDLSKAATKGNDARGADGFSSTPYCDVYFEGLPGGNGSTYSVQVYFRQSDKAPLNASVVGGVPPSFVIFDNNAGSAITGVTVNTTTRTITFANKTMTGSSGEAGTVNGTVEFPPNATTPACGG